MLPEYWIAQRLYYTDIQPSPNNNSDNKQMSRPAVRVALLGIIIGMVVMILTIFIVVGFKQEVTRKITGFTADIQIANYDNNNTYEMQPIALSDTILQRLQDLPPVKQVTPFLSKPAMLKTDSAFEGIVIKGLPLQPQHWQFYQRNLQEGTLPTTATETLLSTHIANKLQLHVGDSYLCYFIQDKIRVRKYTISGLYQTGFEEYDKLFVAADIRQLQQLAELDTNEVSGIDLMLLDLNHLDEDNALIYSVIGNREDPNGNFWNTLTVEQMAPAIFSWLNLLNMNVIVIIILMLAVSGFSIVAGLLILILDNIQLIGTLKALGANNRFIRRIFVAQSAFLLLRGMLIGNIVGLALCALQYFTHLIPLDASAYYVSYVPIAFHWGWWLLLNICTLLISVFILIAPSAIITRISPAKVMKFE